MDIIDSALNELTEKQLLILNLKANALIIQKLTDKTASDSYLYILDSVGYNYCPKSDNSTITEDYENLIKKLNHWALI